MANARSILKMFDGVAESLEGVTNTMQGVLNSYSDAIKKIDSATNAQNKLNNSVDQSGNKIVNMIKKINFTELANSLKTAMAFSDEYVNVFVNLDHINDKLQTTKQLQDKVFASAQRSRGGYLDVAESIGKMGQTASGAFKSNDELIAFHELMQKSFKINGIEPADQQGAMGKVTSVMASGNLGGSDFADMSEYAPEVVTAISNYTGKGKSELMALASSGALSADILKNSMFAASDEINGKFAQIPTTFGEHFTNLKNRAVRSLDPLITGISNLLNSGPVTAFINAVGVGLDQIGVLFNGIVNGAIWFGQVMQANWPIIGGLLAAALVILSGMAIKFAIMAYQQIPALVAKLYLMIAPILTQAAAWMVANMPLLIIATVIGLLVMAMIHFGISVEQVVGFVTGLFFALYANLYNVVAGIYNFIATFVEFFKNAFNDPVYAVNKLFYDLAINFGGYLYNMLRGVEDFVGGLVKTFSALGLDLGIDDSIIHKLSDGLQSKLDKLKKPVSNKDVISIDRMEYKDTVQSFNQGKVIGEQFAGDAMDKLKSGVNNLFNSKDKDLEGKPEAFDPNTFNTSNPSIPNVGKVDKVGAIEQTVDISNEDLKMMRELAEMKSIQNFVTLTPTVQVTTGPVTNNADINTIVSQIERVLEEEISSSAAGVYA